MTFHPCFMQVDELHIYLLSRSKASKINHTLTQKFTTTLMF